MAESGVPEFVIRNEEDAWKLLQAALEGKLELGPSPEIRFEGWPKLQISLDIADSTITPPLMAALLDLQVAIYRTHALYRYGASNVSRLREEEKRALEFVVKVGAGSSLFDIDGQQALNELINAVAGNMDGTDVVILGLGVAILLFGRLAWKDYLDSRARTRTEEVQSADRRAQLEHVQFMSDAETERAKILANAISESPQLPRVDEEADDARHSLLKSIPPSANVRIGDADLDADLAHELAKNARRRSEEVVFSGEFAILRVDTTVPDGFRVRLQNLDDASTFSAGVQDILISEEQRRVIREAEWAKEPIAAKISAKLRGEQLVDAVISDVAKLEKQGTH